MNLATCELFDPGGVVVHTTAKEWNLLAVLAQSRRRVLSRDELITRTSGEDVDSFDRAIDISISRLRSKLAQRDPREIIRTVRGEGYGFAFDVSPGVRE